MTRRLANKVCLITGTGGSTGRAAAVLFPAEGAKIVGCDVNLERDTETAEIVRQAGGEMQFLTPCELTKAESCKRLVEFAVEKYGRINVLYNNAAMAYFGWLDDLTDDVWYKTIDQELNLVLLLTRAAWPYLKKTGNAAIINVGSVSGMISVPPVAGIAHSAAKGGVLAVNRHVALEGRSYGIRSNAISPGLIETAQTAHLLEDPEWAKAMLGKLMLGRLGKPEEIAATALSLASDESSFITGANIPVDGGMTAW